jgi:D-3-phosphoglycerate dehydrogenase
LESGKLIGFGADVLPVEPPLKSNEKDHRMLQKLFDFRNVVLSPHVGGWTIESYERISQILLFNILKYSKLN